VTSKKREVLENLPQDKVYYNGKRWTRDHVSKKLHWRGRLGQFSQL